VMSAYTQEMGAYMQETWGSRNHDRT